MKTSDIIDLYELCYWLEQRPCKCATSGEIMQNLPHLKFWVSSMYASKRKQFGVIYYQVGYGWRLHKFWKRKLDKLSQNVSLS